MTKETQNSIGQIPSEAYTSISASLAKGERRIQEGIRVKAEIDNKRAGFANFMFDSIREQIIKFQKKLSSEEEIGVILANFGTDTIISVENIGYQNPHFIIICGCTEDDKPVQLLQHVSQVNILLQPVPVKQGQQPRKIGFSV